MLKIIPILGIILSCFTGWSQVDFTAEVNRNIVGKNEQFTIEFKVNSKGNNFRAPSFQNFRVLSGPNTSQSTYMDNRGMRYTVSYSYILSPSKVGTFEIGGAQINVDGKTYRTKPITIKVQATSPRANDPNDPYSIAARNAFFKVITSKTSVYQGEPIVASYKVYFKSDIGNPELLEEPDFSNFYKDVIDLKRISTEREMYKGEAYTSGIIHQLVLIPQSTGTIKPGNVELKIPTQIPSNRTDFFGRRVGQTINQTATEQFPNITVKPLPENGKPTNFNGAVGKYNMQASISRNSLNANESVTLKIKISGKGNIKLVEAPQPEIPNAFEVFDPKSSENISTTAAGMSGSKTYEYLLVPRYGGTYKIKPINFSYFDTEAGTYKTISSETFEISVEGQAASGAQNNTGITSTTQESVDFIGKDILYIKTQIGNLKTQNKAFFKSTAFYSILGIIIFIAIAMLTYFFLFYNKVKDYTQQKMAKAGKIAKKHLKEAKVQLDSNQKDAFYLALSNALWGYFSDRFSIPQHKMSKELIREQLLAKNINTELTEAVIEIMNRAEIARYSSIGETTPSKDYTETTQLITEIESQL